MDDTLKIYKWTRIDNLPFNLNYEFCDIREDAECLGEVEEFEVQSYVEERITKKLKKFLDGKRYDDLVYSEQQIFERDPCDDENVYPGYAVYIYFGRELVVELVEYVKEKFPEYALKFA